jgi:hypothetical protein
MEAFYEFVEKYFKDYKLNNITKKINSRNISNFAHTINANPLNIYLIEKRPLTTNIFRQMNYPTHRYMFLNKEKVFVLEDTNIEPHLIRFEEFLDSKAIHKKKKNRKRKSKAKNTNQDNLQDDSNEDELIELDSSDQNIDLDEKITQIEKIATDFELNGISNVMEEIENLKKEIKDNVKNEPIKEININENNSEISNVKNEESLENLNKKIPTHEEAVESAVNIAKKILNENKEQIMDVEENNYI